jgi:outer membrane protein assembly factor BamB
MLGAAPALPAADWPQWRGPARDGFALEPLPGKLPDSPATVWRKSVGHGYAAPVVAAGKLVFLDDAGGQETAHCLEAATGKELWAVAVGENYTDEFEPGPRCTPLIDGDRVYVQTCRGEFRCLAMSDGATRWRFHFQDYGTVWIPDKGNGAGAASRRGNAGSPIIDGDHIIVQIGSAEGACLGAFDKRTGKLLWKSQNDLTTYTSLVIGTLGGRRQAITATCDGLLAVAPEDGTLLWRVPFKTGANRNALTPILGDDTVTFASHTTGLQCQRIVPAGVDSPALKPVEAWFNRQLKINLATPVAVGGHLYGQGENRNFICVDRATGKLAWSQPGFGEVTSTIASGKLLLALSDRGEALLLHANPEKYDEIGRFQACGKTFSHPALADGVLYVRDSRELVGWKLR